MSLLTFADVRPWARAIKTRTGLGPRAGVMPPWYIDKTIGIQQYKNDPSLSAEEIAKVAKWVDNGAPLGNPADMPPPVKFDDSEEWQIGQPDLILTTPKIDMKATAPDWWGDLSGETPTGLTEDRYVAAIEYKEVNNLRRAAGGRQTVGGRFIVHHLGVLAVVDGEPDNLATGFPTHEVGRNADIFEPNAGRLMKAGSKLRFRSAHLHAVGTDATSHIQIGFKLHPKGYMPTQTVRRMGLFGNSMNLDIKPMEANQKFQAFTVLAENAKIIAFEPHMHAAGVRMCLDAIWGAGVSFETLSCVGYDHGWVRIYTFADDAAPLLPKGTILRVTGTFDNTPANKNVVDPRNWSGLGHRSIDNMMNQLGEIDYLTDAQFEQEMAVRRARLGLKPGQAVLGCPLCGRSTAQPTTTAGASQQ
jgi:hypothetical protein